MELKFWTVEEAHAAVITYQEKVREAVRQKDRVQASWMVSDNRKEAYTPYIEQLKTAENNLRHDRLCFAAARKIMYELVSMDLSVALNRTVYEFNGKLFGPKTREKFFNRLKELLSETVPGVRSIGVGYGWYSLEVYMEYDCSPSGAVSVYFKNESPKITDGDNRVDDTTRLETTVQNQYPDDLDQWADAWLEMEERHTREFEEFKARLNKESATLNIGDARMSYVDSMREGFTQ